MGSDQSKGDRPEAEREVKVLPQSPNPQEGVRVFESRRRKAVKKVLEYYDRKKRNGTKEYPEIN